MYAMLGTRPDITYAVSTLSHFLSWPGPKHVQALKHLLCYLKGSADFGIVYCHDGGIIHGCESERVLCSHDSLVQFTLTKWGTQNCLLATNMQDLLSG